MVGALGGSSFGIFDICGNGGVGSRSTHLYLQKVYCWIDGVDVVSYQSRYYKPMINSNKYRYYYSLYQRQEDCFIVSGNGRGGFVPRTTKLFYQKVYFVRERSDGGFRKYHNNYTGTTTTPFLSTDYSVGSDVVY